MRVLFVFMASLTAAICFGCNESRPPESGACVKKTSTTPAPEFRAGNLVTIGDSSYIPLNIEGRTVFQVLPILGALDAFRQIHPELEVTSWSVEKDQEAHSTPATLYGIWVNHRLRTSTTASASRTP